MKKTSAPKNASPKTAQQSGDLNKQNNDTEFHARIEALLCRSIPKRSRRVAVYLASRKTPPWTFEIARSCAVANVSDALATIRDDLRAVGLQAFCFLPTQKLRNRFGDISQVHKWHLVLT